jgi:hypothetical protein
MFVDRERPGGWKPRVTVAAFMLAAGILATACGRLDVPSVAIPGSGNKGMASMVENRVWLKSNPDAAPGAFRAFLGDGTLVMTSCGEVYRLAPWRWVDGATLVWEEDGRSIRGEIAEVGHDSMVLLVDPDGENRAVEFRVARAPVVCPDRRG